MANLGNIKFRPINNPARLFANCPKKPNLEQSSLQIIKKLENPNKNPLLSIIKNFSDNPQKLQKEVKKLLKGHSQKACDYLLDILAQYDKITAKHEQKVADIAVNFGKYLRLPARKIKEIKIASLMHDSGKLNIPEAILQKPGRLTEAEYLIMNKHAQYGREIIEQLGLTKISHIFERASMLAEKHHTQVKDLYFSKTSIKGEQVLTLADEFQAIMQSLTKERKYPTWSSSGEAPKTLSDIELTALKELDKNQTAKKMWDTDLLEKFKEFVKTKLLSEQKK
jgi:hypothetical protein